MVFIRRALQRADQGSRLQAVKHEEFDMPSGEMDRGPVHRIPPVVALPNGRARARRGDPLHLYGLAPGDEVGFELKNLCVWNKDNRGMGSFCRYKHELVCAWKHDTAPHTNNFELGQHGRYRTNVWDYAGVNTMKSGRAEELAMHPTVKPVALVADAIRDVSQRKGIVLDPFCSSGTTIIAAEKTGRRARAIELAPKYVDVAVRRWERYTGKTAVLDGTGQTFDDVEAARTAANDSAMATEEVA